jgi:hypothetical protein
VLSLETIVTVAELPSVPLSQPLERGTLGYSPKSWDSVRDSRGTVDLKTLARNVLQRDSARDSNGTRPKSTVPRPRGRWDTCPAGWRDGFTLLDANRPPAGFTSAEWRCTIRDAELFLSTWGRQAVDLGWTTLDVFGVHRLAPVARYSCMGLLPLIQGGRVIAITAESARIEQPSGARLTYTRRPPEAGCVAVWDLLAGVIVSC